MSAYVLTHDRESGGMEGVSQTLCCTNKKEVEDSLISYVCNHLYEVFWYGCEISLVVKGNTVTPEAKEEKNFDLLSGITLTVEDAFSVNAGTKEVTIKDEEKVKRWEPDYWLDSTEAKKRTRTALCKLFWLHNLEWKTEETKDEKVLTVTEVSLLKGSDLVPESMKEVKDLIPKKLVLHFKFPELPDLKKPLITKKKKEKLSEDWY
jgi:hypothetical protein